MDIKEVDKITEELVSRRMVTDRLEEAYNDVLIWEDDDDWSRGIKEGIYNAMTVINALPSAQPVVKRGKWIKRDGGALGYVCSCCGKSDVSNHFDFCPNCGADMRDQEGKYKPLICTCCGAKINRDTMRCEYCGTEYLEEQKDGK